MRGMANLPQGNHRMTAVAAFLWNRQSILKKWAFQFQNIQSRGAPGDNQELLLVRDKVGRPPGELRVSKSMECDIFPLVL